MSLILWINEVRHEGTPFCLFLEALHRIDNLFGSLGIAVCKQSLVWMHLSLAFHSWRISLQMDYSRWSVDKILISVTDLWQRKVIFLTGEEGAMGCEQPVTRFILSSKRLHAWTHVIALLSDHSSPRSLFKCSLLSLKDFIFASERHIFSLEICVEGRFNPPLDQSLFLLFSNSLLIDSEKCFHLWHVGCLFIRLPSEKQSGGDVKTLVWG